jgi:hypothetical protein
MKKAMRRGNHMRRGNLKTGVIIQCHSLALSMGGAVVLPSRRGGEGLDGHIVRERLHDKIRWTTSQIIKSQTW